MEQTTQELKQIVTTCSESRNHIPKILEQIAKKQGKEASKSINLKYIQESLAEDFRKLLLPHISELNPSNSKTSKKLSDSDSALHSSPSFDDSGLDTFVFGFP